MVKTAVIIAAGNGIRLMPFSGDLPKPLVRVAGVPLIERVIRGALKAGIESFVVVTGYESEQIRGHLDRIPELASRITWIYNPDYQLLNGGSVLKAREAVSEDFALLMSDHLFDPIALARLLKAPRSSGECLLGVDRNLSEVSDLEDATKVRLKGDRIVDIGKTLNGFDAVDTGIFVCSTRLFDALADAASGSDPGCSLSDGVQRLAKKGLMTTLDLSDTSWHDVDTPEALKNAERFLYRSTRKPTDGPVSRLLNRHISIRFSRLFLYLGLSPNQISVMTFVLGLLAALSASYGDYAHVAIAGLLFQLSSILDGSDGEVAKLRMTGSVKGEWFDTILDCVTYLAFFVGVTVGLYEITGTSGVLFIGFLTIATAVLNLSVLYFYLLNTGSGSLRKFAVSFSQLATGPQKNLLLQVLNRLEFAIRRDFFSLLFCVFALFNCLNWIFAAIIIGIFMLTVGVAVSAGRLLGERGGKLQGQSLTTEEVRYERRYSGD